MNKAAVTSPALAFLEDRWDSKVAAKVVKGSTMFPRDRMIASLTKYDIPFQESFSDEKLRGRLASFYAERTQTQKAIDPIDCAEAIVFLASPRSRCTTGHLIPVDGGLTEAFFR